MDAGRLDRAQGPRVADERGLDGIGRPLPRRSIVEDHVGLVHVDVVAEEPDPDGQVYGLCTAFFKVPQYAPEQINPVVDVEENE